MRNTGSPLHKFEWRKANHRANGRGATELDVPVSDLAASQLPATHDRTVFKTKRPDSATGRALVPNDSLIFQAAFKQLP
jgi:hypothetical protein